MMSNWFS